MKICYQKAGTLQHSTRRMILRAEEILDHYATQGYQMTLRQLYYQFVARGLFEKAHRDPRSGSMTINHLNNYKKLGEAMTTARMGGLIDWNHLEDRTRRLTEWQTFETARDSIDHAFDNYYLDHWTTQEVVPEIWVEKEALGAIMKRVASKYGVPVFPCRGYGSVSSKHDSWERIADRWSRNNQTTLILHFGDHDPSGLDMTRDITESLKVFHDSDHGMEQRPYRAEDIIEVRRLALNMNQIRVLKPVPQPNKKSDPREEWYAAKYGQESWELDALDPVALHKLVEDELAGVIEPVAWAKRLRKMKQQKLVFKKILRDLDSKKRK